MEIIIKILHAEKENSYEDPQAYILDHQNLKIHELSIEDVKDTDIFKENSPLESFLDVLGIPVSKTTRQLIPRCQNKYIYEPFYQLHQIPQRYVWVTPTHLPLLHLYKVEEVPPPD